MNQILFPPRPGAIFGRERELRAINDRLDRPADPTCVLLILGAGGNGKTHLLTEVARGLAEAGRPFLPLYDFYHIENFKPGAIEAAIVRAFGGPGDDEFAEYREALARLEQVRQRDENIAEAQHQLRERFVACYNARAAREIGRPLVLLFDTVEQAVGLGDGAEQALDMGSDDASRGGEHWLRAILPRLQNTVALLSGRETTLYGQPVELYDALAASPEIDVERVPVDGIPAEHLGAFVDSLRASFSESSQPALRELAQTLQLDPPTLAAWQALSGGQPFWVSMLFSCAMLRAVPPALDDLRRRLERGEPAPGPDEREALRGALMSEILHGIESDADPRVQAIQWMAVARKGLTVELLASLADASGVELDAGAVWEQLSQLLIVKGRRVPRYTRPEGPAEEELLFLHDELYAWIDRASPMGRQLAGPLSQHIRDWYDTAIARAEAARLEAVVRLESLADDARRRHTLQELRREAAARKAQLTLDRLTYYFQVGVEAGLGEYSQQAYAAILRRDLDYYISLRQEALRSLYRLVGGPPPAFAIEAAAHWVLRALHSEDNRQAQATIAAARQLYADVAGAGPSLALLELAEAQVRLETGGESLPGLLDLFDRAEELLGDEAEDDSWRAFLRAQICNWRGLYYRRSYQLFDAIETYTRSLRLAQEHRRSFPELRAQTINNLAFAYSEQGESDTARELGRLGLTLNRRYGSDYNIALSLNTLARIELRAGNPEMALSHLTAPNGAFALLKSLESARGLSMCLPVIVEAYRKHGELLDHDIAQQRASFQAAQRVGHMALGHFEEHQVRSPERRRELFKAIGLNYRSQGMALRRHGAAAEQADEQLEQARHWLDQARAVAEAGQPALIQMDIIEDVAVLLLSRGQLGEPVDAVLAQAEALAPPEYHLREGGLPEISRPVRAYWRELGQCQLQRALNRLKLAQLRPLPADLNAAGGHIVQMLAYLLRYAPGSQALSQAEGLLVAELCRLTAAAQLDAVAAGAEQARMAFGLQQGEVALRVAALIGRARASVELQLEWL